MLRSVLFYPQGNPRLLGTVLAGPRALVQALPGLLQLSRHAVSGAQEDTFHGHGSPRTSGVLAVHN
eukprot:7734124-Lingulodinium_polyedra.AAC.1